MCATLPNSMKAGHDVGIICDSLTGGSFEDSLFRRTPPTFPSPRALADLSFISPRLSVVESIEIKGLRPDVLHGHGARVAPLPVSTGSALRVNRHRVARPGCPPHGGSLHYTNRTAAGRTILTAELRFDAG